MEEQYVLKGQVANAAIGSIIALVVGVGIVTIVVIFISVLGGQTYNLSSANFNFGNGSSMAISISTAINESILAGFTTLETTTGYVPLIVLAVIIFIVLTLVLGFTAFSGGGGMGGGSAL